MRYQADRASIFIRVSSIKLRLASAIGLSFFLSTRRVVGQPAGYQVQGYCTGDNGHCFGGGSDGSWGANCMCNPGQAGPYGYCCIPCAAGTYEPNFGATGLGIVRANNNFYMTCSLQCPAGSFASPGATACSTCLAGSFSGPGAGSCTLCSSNQFSNDGSSSCTTCPPGSVVAGNACVCPDGQFFNVASGGGVSCSACPPGSFRTRGVNDLITLCNVCPAGTFSNATGAVDNSTCLQCDAGSSSAPASSHCVPCSAGS